MHSLSGTLAPLMDENVSEAVEDIPAGSNEMVVRCVEGKYKGRFFYVNLSVI